jgi:hypothetical protein
MESLPIDEPHKKGRETIIENAIIARPDLLGYPGALAIRNWRVDPRGGVVDLGLFPQNGPVRLVLVEAKAFDAHDAASKCVGQLMMYYAGALMLGSDGLDALHSYARGDSDRAHSESRTSLRMLAKTKSNPEAWEVMSGGQPVTPNQVRLFLALDGEPRQALEPILECLRDRHLLHIGLVLVRDGVIVRVVKPEER